MPCPPRSGAIVPGSLVVCDAEPPDEKLTENIMETTSPGMDNDVPGSIISNQIAGTTNRLMARRHIAQRERKDPC